MTDLARLVDRVGGERVVLVWGGLYVVVATGRALFVATTGRPLAAALIDFVLVGGPGLVLLYGGYRLPGTEIHPDTYSRVVAWCFAGFALTLGVIELVNLEPGVTIAYPRWSYTLGAAVGTAGGFAVGVNDARAVSRAREAERHNAELQRQNDRLESFASMLAHEVRNPLSIAQIYLPTAADGDADAADEVETALDRIEEMIDVLLVTARGTDATIDYASVSLAEVASEAWADLPAESADLVVETDLAVRADPVHLRHLLENLFANALEHGDAETIRVGGLTDADGFYVEDDGSGVPADERDAVFDAGYTTEADGIGMGLTFVEQLSETYGWTCTAAESTDGGMRFDFTDVELVSNEPRRVH